MPASLKGFFSKDEDIDEECGELDQEEEDDDRCHVDRGHRPVPQDVPGGVCRLRLVQPQAPEDLGGEQERGEGEAVLQMGKNIVG